MPDLTPHAATASRPAYRDDRETPLMTGRDEKEYSPKNEIVKSGDAEIYEQDGAVMIVIPGRATSREPGIYSRAVTMAYYVYLLASKKNGTLYLGVTNDIVRRGYEHRTKAVDGFTTRYGVNKLVWFEVHDDALTAITREKELKKWRRAWKIRLIEENNREWVDLYPEIAS